MRSRIETKVSGCESGAGKYTYVATLVGVADAEGVTSVRWVAFAGYLGNHASRRVLEFDDCRGLATTCFDLDYREIGLEKQTI